MPDRSPPSPLALGELVLDRYRAIEHIATGGHSVVYRGRDERLARPVCIKVFCRFPGDPGISRTSYEHFVQEAFALSRLTHPHTLRIYDFGHLPGEELPALPDEPHAEPGKHDGAVPFHVSEFMNGGTLAQQVRERGAHSVADTLRVAVAIADALHEAHSVGIIHRDLKPQNILFAALGTSRLPKLADFGIAKWLEDGEPGDHRDVVEGRAGDTRVVSGQRMAMYSPSWAAPEQLAGQDIDPTADIYSLALMIVYMLTGRAIFADDDVYEGYRKRKSSASILQVAVEPLGLPADVLDLLQRALAFEPGERPQDASAFGVELADAFEPTTGQPPRLGPPPAPPPRLEPTSLLADAPVRLDPTPTPPPRLVERTRAPSESPTSERSGPRPARATRRLSVGAGPVALAGRSARFVAARGGVADVAGLGGAARLRLTLLPNTTGRRQVHVKGMSCFLAKPGGRPSIAVQLEQDQMLELINPGHTPLGRVRIAVGTPAAGHTVFRFGDESVAIGLEECPEVVLADFGNGAECSFVYTPGATDAHGKPKRSRT